MSIAVFTKDYQRSDTSRYVFGLSAKDRFTKWLMKMLTRNKDDVLSLGLTIHICSHEEYTVFHSSTISTTSVDIRDLGTIGPNNGL